ncbi:MAG: dTDP-glucose 4,6-dehydratase [Bacillota bacterium]|jgi:dTDP-glucose 4,6-dehydratase
MNVKRILVAGGAGFIGSNFIRYMLNKYQNYRLINLDKLTYAGNLDNLEDVASDPKYAFVRGDIAEGALVEQLFGEGVDYIVNFAAESHVDRSIIEPDLFVRTNVVGTQVLLQAAYRHRIKKYVQISTDEVYGSLEETGLFTEDSPLLPNSPYSASKAGADLLVRAYHMTYGVPVNITRCSNNYGPYQHPEKLIPLFVANALEDKELPLYGDGRNVRDWLHVLDHCRAIDLVMHRGKNGEIYNVGGNNEQSNLEITRLILGILGKPESIIKFVADRPGHDRRYAVDAGKIQGDLGWQPGYDFVRGIKETVRWYVENRDWWQKVRAGRLVSA